MFVVVDSPRLVRLDLIRDARAHTSVRHLPELAQALLVFQVLLHCLEQIVVKLFGVRSVQSESGQDVAHKLLRLDFCIYQGLEKRQGMEAHVTVRVGLRLDKRTVDGQDFTSQDCKTKRGQAHDTSKQDRAD